MFKALLKKQIRSLLSGLALDKRTGKERGKMGKAGFVLIFVLLFFSVFAMFMGLSDAICGAFTSVGLTWLYFALSGLSGLVIAVVGSAFMSYSALFQAKDNELLMSMPIPPGMILFTRMLSIWFIGFLFEFIAIAASVLIYGTNFGFGGGLILRGVLLVLFSSFLALALSCLLGWLVALLMSKVSNKSAVTVIFTLVFLGGYYTIYFRIQSILKEVVAAGENLAGAIKTWVWPIYQFGLAGAGDTAALVKYCAVCVAVLALVYRIISKSFIKIATANKGAVKKEYKAAPQKAESVKKALFRKELRHFVNSPAYMLNGGLGIIAMPALAVLLLVKIDVILPAIETLADAAAPGLITMGLLSALCLLTTLNCITAPSISIEGKTFWVTKSMPIDYVDFLDAKEKLHLVLTCIPAVPAVIISVIALKLDLVSAAYLFFVVMAFIWMMADLGLFLNLKMPKMDWQNETAAVKSSLSALICIFGGWAVAVLPAIGCLVLSDKAPAIGIRVQLTAWFIIFALAAELLNKAIKKQGPVILQSL